MLMPGERKRCGKSSKLNISCKTYLDVTGDNLPALEGNATIDKGEERSTGTYRGEEYGRDREGKNKP